MDRHRLCFQLLLVLPIICGQRSFGNMGNKGSIGNMGSTGNMGSMGKFQEAFAWKQLTYDIEGDTALHSRYSADAGDNYKNDRNSQVYFNDDDGDDDGRIWDQRPMTQANTGSALNDSTRFFTQYNNVPMGVEKVGRRIFITVPRRRYGIPSTLNYIDTNDRSRSPALKPYPNLRGSPTLTSVYRTRADSCGRLWMVDTGLLEIPNNPQQVQPPAIVVFDLTTDRQILRYPFKSSDIPAANTPTGLASITLDVGSNCMNTFAYVPDLTTFGVIVYSLRDNDSWRLTHNYFHFNPLFGNLNVRGVRFQWSDGIFSLTLGPSSGGCRTAYFHPLISIQEFSVSTCVLQNRSASDDPDYFSRYNLVGERGNNSLSTMHEYDAGTSVVFFAEIGRNAISCWNSARELTPNNVALLAMDGEKLSYPSDLHITDDEVWVMSNKLPIFSYANLNTAEYNFYIHKAKVQDLISGTICADTPLLFPSYGSSRYQN